MVTSIEHVIDISTLEPQTSTNELKLNDIGQISFKLSTPVAFDAFSENQNLGSFIIIDEVNNSTLGAGIILDSSDKAERSEAQSYSI